MEFVQNNKVLIEIDDEIASLIQEMNEAPAGRQQTDFVKATRDVIIDSIIGPFGLSRHMFTDKDGGSVTTVHNFKQGITATETDAERYRNYEHALNNPIDGALYRSDLAQERRAAFSENESIVDAYTGRELPKDGTAQIDHVISIKSIEQSPESHLAQTRDERVQTANVDENKAWTSRAVNQSKQDKPLTEWMEQPNVSDPTKTNAEYYGVDEKRALEHHQKAEKAVQSEIHGALIRKQSKEALQTGIRTGVRLALRQMIGLFLVDIAEGIIADIRYVIRQGMKSVQDFAELLKKRMKETADTVRARWKDYLRAGMEGGIAGFLSSIITVVINNLLTTAKHIVTIIREGTLAVVRSARLIISPPPHMSKEDVVFEVLKILSSAFAIALGLSMEEVVKKGLTLVPGLAPMADTIARVVTGVLTGMGALLVMLAFDHLKAHIQFKKKEIADLHRGQSVALLQIKQTVFLIDEAARHAHGESERLRDELNTSRAHMNNMGHETDDVIEEYSTSVEQMKRLLEEL